MECRVDTGGFPDDEFPRYTLGEQIREVLVSDSDDLSLSVAFTGEHPYVHPPAADTPSA